MALGKKCCHEELQRIARTAPKKKLPPSKIAGVLYIQKIKYYKVFGSFLARIIKNSPAIINGILSHCPVEKRPKALSKPP